MIFHKADIRFSVVSLYYSLLPLHDQSRETKWYLRPGCDASCQWIEYHFVFRTRQSSLGSICSKKYAQSAEREKKRTKEIPWALDRARKKSVYLVCYQVRIWCGIKTWHLGIISRKESTKGSFSLRDVYSICYYTVPRQRLKTKNIKLKIRILMSGS